MTRLGSSATTKLDIQIVAATNKNLKSLVDEGKFREDLYYR
ncbi:sigma 54-interacting transcriptional regulator, partial [Bacillus thermotolerans]